MNDAYNNGNLDGEETGKKVCYIEAGDAVMNHLTHAFESNVNNDEADPTLTLTSLGPTPTYNPEVHADISDMRYEMRLDRYGREESPDWTYTPRTEKTVRTASDMPADEDATQTVDLLSLSSRLDSYRMRVNKSKLYWDRQMKTLNACAFVDRTFSDGSKAPTAMPFDSELEPPFRRQKISRVN